MLNKLTSAIGMVLLANTFAFAGQTSPTAPRTEQSVTTQAQPTHAKTHHRAKKHHKHHKHHKHQATTQKR